MIEWYTSWPRDLLEAFDAAARVSPGGLEEGSLVIGCGMGGSGFSVDAARYVLEELGTASWRAGATPRRPTRAPARPWSR
ncbi:hypothetical protein JCM10135_00020 [Stetteria hydrogenophila]